MLDLNYVREHPEVIKENLARRQEPEKIKWIDELLQIDEEWRNLKGKMDSLRHRRNTISQEINSLKKEGKDAKKAIDEVKSLPQTIAEVETKSNELLQKMRALLMKIPNLLHESVPFGKSDADNVVIKKFGKVPKFKFALIGHEELMLKHDLIDLERAAKIAGARQYFLKNELAILQMSLLRYAVDFLRKKGYSIFIPPFMMNRRAHEGVTSLDAFEDTMYKIEGEDLYLIATSEFPGTAQFIDEVMPQEKLPMKIAGISSCFRKEAGAHGKDTKGIFRVHQFNKVEQLIICKPEDSWQFHEELIKNATEFFESLGLHGQVVNICTGDIGIVAAKKYDINIWMPIQQAYREVVSCSNCTSYQAVRLNLKYQDGADKKYLHTLNSTCTTDTRPLVAIFENFQQKDGTILVPKVLQKYCGFKVIGKIPKKQKLKKKN